MSDNLDMGEAPEIKTTCLACGAINSQDSREEVEYCECCGEEESQETIYFCNQCKVENVKWKYEKIMVYGPNAKRRNMHWNMRMKWETCMYFGGKP